MCTTCGCEGGMRTGADDALRTHAHDGGEEHTHGHSHLRPERTKLSVEERVLARNDTLAEENRTLLLSRGILALNLVSSPGAGKTTLLEKLVLRLVDEPGAFVIEGDQATERDAERVRDAGARAVQINTGAGCHLDALSVKGALAELDPPSASVLFIENVGNLVCPALFDLGERAKMLVVSVTEGEDKPLKYPHMFRASDVLVLNKIDLLPFVSFDVDHFLSYAKVVNPKQRVFRVSATTGEGMDELESWIRKEAGPA